MLLNSYLKALLFFIILLFNRVVKVVVAILQLTRNSTNSYTSTVKHDLSQLALHIMNFFVKTEGTSYRL